jgi:lactate dehydrogenase-like 2-hydroxyacid dehydrogenase
MRFSKRVQEQVSFAKFCLSNKITDPAGLAELGQLIARRARFAAKSLSAHQDEESQRKADAKDEKLIESIRQKAAQFDMTVEFSGLYPSIKIDDKVIHLHEIPS